MILIPPPYAIKGITVNKMDEHLNSPLHLWASLPFPWNDGNCNVTIDKDTFENSDLLLVLDTLGKRC